MTTLADVVLKPLVLVYRESLEKGDRESLERGMKLLMADSYRCLEDHSADRSVNKKNGTRGPGKMVQWVRHLLYK